MYFVSIIACILSQYIHTYFVFINISFIINKTLGKQHSVKRRKRNKIFTKRSPYFARFKIKIQWPEISEL